MAGQISQRFIDDLLARTDIAELVAERVTLKKAGRNLSGLCPFHDEKSPSFTVSREKQFYHCFGCGAHGNALRFLMEYDRLRFPEAVEQLAARLGVEVEREDDQLSPHQREQAQVRERKREEGANLLELASDWFRHRLGAPEAEHARRYLDGRGLDASIIDAFAIGFAPESWDALKHHLAEHGVSEAVQAEYGLLVQHEKTGRTYDRFRDRVIFPIRDWKGRTLGFGGRVLGDAKPKYLNSPETPVFHKGRELYGLFEARRGGARLERLVVVEGYMDVVALAQHGISNAVATLGTAATEDHLKRLYRLVDEVVFCFDGDDAGRRAARRALEVALPVMIDGRQARFLFLPEREDPDSLVRSEGREAFEARIECASPLSEFLFDQAREGLDLKRVEGRERFVSRVLERLRLLPEGLLRSLLMRELANRSGVEMDQLERFAAPAAKRADPAMTQFEPAGQAGDEAQWERAPVSSARATAVGRRGSVPLSLRALHLLLHAPTLVGMLPEGEGWCPDDEHGVLLQEVARLLRAGGYRSSQVILAHFYGSERGRQLEALMRREPMIPAQAREAELKALVELFERRRERLSPEEEYRELLARSQRGETLAVEEKRRLWELIGVLNAGPG